MTVLPVEIQMRESAEITALVKRSFEKYTTRGFPSVSGWVSQFPQDYLTTIYVKETFKAVKGEPHINGKTFAESHTKGRYVLNMARPLAVCVLTKLYMIILISHIYAYMDVGE